jgi:predicted RNase H-like HicB family nuclease
MAVDAIRAYLDSLLKDGQPIPADKKLSADPATEATTVT